MTQPSPESLAYYTQPGLFTQIDDYAHLFKQFPVGIPERVARVQGLLLNVLWAESYGVTPGEQREDELNLRTVPEKLQRILELDGQALTVTRTAENRLLGNSRDYATLLVAILRLGGLPARARCGFATFFRTGRYEDYWVVEYWDKDQQRWVMVASQIDAYQRSGMGIEWDQFDMPGGLFVSGGRSWLACRMGEADPDDFGVFEFKGLDFVRGNLLRDVLALNKVEPLPWDVWGYLETPVAQLKEHELEGFDQLAALTLDPDANFDTLREVYESDPLVHHPSDWEPETDEADKPA
ncbi:MAG TPA: transglutaminase domain-containing protein [Anaerolineales bacterium]|nr:transglutaminase domain-containing protein [Anaerolineales bacterium]